MASLVLDPRSGYYYAQFFDANRSPKRKRIPLRTRRKRVASRALVSLEDQYALHEFDPWLPPTLLPDEQLLLHLGDAVEAYLASCSHLKPKTIQSYKDVLYPFLKHSGPGMRVTSLRPVHISDWLDTTEANDVTRRKYVNHLGYLFRFLVRRGEMERDISKDVPLRKVAQTAPKSLSPLQLALLISTIKNYRSKTKVADFSWLARLIEFNVHVGLRRGELIHLRREHVDVDGRILRVMNTGEFTTKSSCERTIPLSTRAAEIVQEQFREPVGDGYVFQLGGQKLNHNTLSQYFKRFRKRAGLPAHFNLHSTRHTFATRLAEEGTPAIVIQMLMGHASIKTTERYMSMRADIAERWIQTTFEDANHDRSR